MLPKDIFGIIVRAAGLVVLRWSMWEFRNYTQWHYEASQRTTDPAIYLIWGTGCLVLGAYLLAGAPHLVRFSYPELESPDTESEGSENQQG